MNSQTYIWEEPLYRLIIQITVVQVVVLFVIILGIILTRAWRLRQEQKYKQISQALFEPLMSFLAGDASIEETHRLVRSYPRVNLCRDLERYALMVEGSALARVRALYEQLNLRNYGIRLSGSRLWWRRLEGVRILGAAGGHDVVDVLLDSLADNHNVVRLAAARSLGKTKNPKAIAPLLQMMSDTQQISRRQLAQTLIAFGPAAHPALRRIIVDQMNETHNHRFIATVLEVLAITGDNESAPEIRRALSSTHIEVRIAAFKAVQLLHIPLTTAQLKQGLEDEEWPVRAQAALAAGKLGGTSIVAALGQCLSDRSWWVRHNAGTALANLGRSGAEELIRVSRESDDPFARDMAIRALSNEGGYQLPQQRKEAAETTPVPTTAAPNSEKVMTEGG